MHDTVAPTALAGRLSLGNRQLVYQVNQLSLGLDRLQKTIKHKMNAVGFLVTTYLQRAVEHLQVLHFLGVLFSDATVSHTVIKYIVNLVRYIVLYQGGGA